MKMNFTATLATGEVLTGTVEVCVQYWTYNPRRLCPCEADE